MRVGRVEREALGDLIGQTSREPETIVVRQAGGADCRRDRSNLVGDTGAQRQVRAVAIFTAEREEPAVTIVEGDRPRQCRRGERMRRDVGAADAAPALPFHRRKQVELLGDLLAQGDVQTIRQAHRCLDARNRTRQARHVDVIAIKRLVDARAVADADGGAGERLPGQTGGDADAPAIAFQPEAIADRQGRAAAHEAHLHVLDLQADTDRELRADLVGHRRRKRHRARLSRQRIQAATQSRSGEVVRP